MDGIQKHAFSEWVATTRYWSFSVSALPVVATVAYLCASRGFAAVDWLAALLSVVGVVAFHAAGNLLSDVGDFLSGVDCEEAFSVPNLVKHLFTPKEYLVLSAALFVVGIVIGLFLASRSSWALLVVGVLGFVLTVLYTHSKFFFLSDACIFVVFGVLILLGTSVAVVGVVCYDVLLLSLPLGLITLSVLHANNAVDMQTDAAAGLHTVAMALGLDASSHLYVVYQVAPFAFVVAAVVAGWLPWPALLCVAAFPMAWGNIRQSLQCKAVGREAMMGLDLKSAKLQLVFSMALAVGLFVSAFLCR